MEEKKIDEKIVAEETSEKKLELNKLIVPGLIAIILIAFAGIVYYGKYVKPRKDIDKDNGYVTEEYIELGKTAFTYTISQEAWDECVKEETDSYETVERACKDTDMVEYNIIGYVKGKKDSNITRKELSITLGEGNEGLALQIEKAVLGHKAGDKIELKDVDANQVSKDGSDYTGKKTSFVIKVISVSKLVSEKITDKWVKENYYEDFGLENTKDFYDWCREYLVENDAKEALWQMAIDDATMNGYPQKLYDKIVEEVNGDLQATAESEGMTIDEYINYYRYTDEQLEKEYSTNVKAELVMWQIIKDELYEATSEEIEQEYEEKYLDVNMDSAEEMKELYTDDEMRESVLLGKVKDYILENSTIKDGYKIS